MPKENKIKVSVRLEPDNYDLVRYIADVLYRDEDDVEGNFSQSLNFLIELLRKESLFSPTLHYFELRGKYLRGDRSEKVLEGMRSFERILLLELQQVTD